MLTVSLCCVFVCKQTKNTTHSYCQHWVHQTQDKNKQTKTQHRDTVNIGYSRHRTKTNKQKTQHIYTSISVLCFLFVCLCPVSGVPNVDSISILCFCLFVSVLCLVYPMLTVSLCCVFFVCLPDTGQKQTNKNTTHRYCQHWVHQTQDRDKQTKPQYRDTVNIGYTRHRTETNTMLTVSLCCVLFCLSLCCVWCTQC
jgi:hypothetical protein